MIYAFVSPDNCPQVHATIPQPLPAPRLDDVDRRIIEAVRDVQRAKVWSILNMLSDDPGLDRAAGREARLILWQRIKRLKRMKIIHGVGRNEVAATKPSRQPARPRPRERKGTVVSAPVFCGVSATCPRPMPTIAESNEPSDIQLVRVTKPSGANAQEPQETKTAPDPAQVTQAARSLARLPRRPRRRWSGMIGRVRSYRNMLIELPDERVVYALGSKRGRVAYTSEPDGPIGSLEGLQRDWGVIRASQVRVINNPDAVLIGGLKRGIKEAPSPHKQAAARVNGSCPVRAGRKRGRPRRSRIGVAPAR